MQQRTIRRLWTIISLLVVLSMLTWTIGAGFQY